MAQLIEVLAGRFAIGKAPDTLASIGVGSCLAICLYAPSYQTGALMHCMLPRATQPVANPGIYVDTAINTMLEELLKLGIHPTDLSAKLIGGAAMFPTLAASDTQNIGKRNLEEAMRILETIHVRIISNATGGNRGRSLNFDLNTGDVMVTTAFDPAAVKI